MSNLFQTRQDFIDFHNDSTSPVCTTIAGADITVPAGGNLSLPRHLAWVVKSRGLRLKDGRHPDANAPDALMRKHKPPKQVLPRGVELGEIKERAREENEDEDVGDGPSLAGDDGESDPDTLHAPGADDGGDPIERAASQLKDAGVDLDSLPGARRGKAGGKKDRPLGVL